MRSSINEKKIIGKASSYGKQAQIRLQFRRQGSMNSKLLCFDFDALLCLLLFSRSFRFFRASFTVIGIVLNTIIRSVLAKSKSH
ncbi:unnamed protein product [Brugia timori]|uniref:Uncharacterized protein n=1 Tax=Brugia timori TaxID=42155 RepID=A0A0R3QVP3_9BILA|nr:unnamed protein product [Brugia timori]